MLVPIGGDGTFLMTAGRSSPLLPEFPKTPVVGFNSDPERSEGRLMLPKHYSQDPKEAVRKMKNVNHYYVHLKNIENLINFGFYYNQLQGDFKWIHRSRIKITLLGQNGNISQAIDLHEHNFEPLEPVDFPPQPLKTGESKQFGGAKMKKVLPYLALNEVTYWL